jgi:flagellar motility protein MotE (MotC chaperone)
MECESLEFVRSSLLQLFLEGDWSMSTEPNTPETISEAAKSVIAEVSPEPKALPGYASSEIKQETEALVDAIRRRAEQEMQSASDFTRQSYLKIVRQARESVEHNTLIDPQRLEESIDSLQKEVEQNLQGMMTEVTAFGDRLTEAAKAAWEKLLPPESNK